MATVTSKGRGRKGKVVSDASNAGQSAVDANAGVGHGQVGAGQSGAPAKSGGAIKRISWDELVEKVKAEPEMIASAWHHAPESEVINLNACDVRVIQGEPAYQLTTGEIIKL